MPKASEYVKGGGRREEAVMICGRPRRNRRQSILRSFVLRRRQRIHLTSDLTKNDVWGFYEACTLALPCPLCGVCASVLRFLCHWHSIISISFSFSFSLDIYRTASYGPSSVLPRPFRRGESPPPTSKSPRKKFEY